MNKQIKAAAISFLLFATGAVAQTTVTGTGATNTIPLFTGSSTLGSSVITQNSGNIGIGFSSALSHLTVYGAASIGEFTNGTALIDAFNGNAYFGNNSVTNGIAVNTQGFVGVGTSSPCGHLSIGTSVACPTGVSFLNSFNSGQIMMENTTGGTDAKLWDQTIAGNSLYFRAVNDANTAANAWLQVTRSGYTIAGATFPEAITVSPTTGTGNAILNVTAVINNTGAVINLNAPQVYTPFASVSWNVNGANQFGQGFWGTGNASGLAGGGGLFDATTSHFVWSTNPTDDLYFYTPVTNVTAGAGAVASILHTGAIRGTSLSDGTAVLSGGSLTGAVKGTFSNSIGIGTATPGSPLEVNGNIAITHGSAGALVFADGSSLSSATGLVTQSGGGGSITSLGTVTTGVWHATPLTSAYLPSDIDYIDQAQTISGQKSFMSNVGIGTTNPGAALDVESGSVNIGSGVLNIPGGGGGTNPPIHFTSLAPAGFNPGGNLGFWLASTGLINANAGLSIGGNTGIGTTSPGQLLQVGATYSQNPAIMIGGTDSNNSSTGSYALLFGAYRDVESIASGIVATPSWVCCGGYPAAGYAGIRQNSLGFYTIYDPAKPTAYSPNMLISTNGNVGIGTATPGASLEVNGNLKLTQGSGASITYPDGTVQSTAWNGTLPGGDYAESIDVQGDRTTYEPGDVIVIDPTAPGKFIKSEKAYSKLVAGVFSTKPGLVGRRTTAARLDKDAEVPMAMMGIVPTKVSSENGTIEPGDLLVSASTPGYAMKGTDSARLIGAVIGKALAPLKSDAGVIEVLISLQ